MNIIATLKRERKKLQKKVDGIDAAIKALHGDRRGGRKRGRKMSAATRAKMSKAQKKRWSEMNK